MDVTLLVQFIKKREKQELVNYNNVVVLKFILIDIYEKQLVKVQKNVDK